MGEAVVRSSPLASGRTVMTVCYARVIALAAILVALSALGPSSRLHAQQTLTDLLLAEQRTLAEQGDAEAQHNLGVRYAYGIGVPHNDAEAVRWYRLAADQGDTSAQYILGFMYASGQGVLQDAAEAVRWYRLAADLGHADAQFRLGNMYASSEGIPRDYVEAHMWFNLSAAQSSGEARESSMMARDTVAGRLTAEQVGEAQRRALEWKPTPEP